MNLPELIANRRWREIAALYMADNNFARRLDSFKVGDYANREIGQAINALVRVRVSAVGRKMTPLGDGRHDGQEWTPPAYRVSRRHKHLSQGGE